MKKIIYVVFVTIILAACAQTKEHKAEILIKESLKKVLYKPETYKAVDTQITEAFSPDDDPDFIIEVKKLVNIATELGFLDSPKRMPKRKWHYGVIHLLKWVRVNIKKPKKSTTKQVLRLKN